MESAELPLQPATYLLSRKNADLLSRLLLSLLRSPALHRLLWFLPPVALFSAGAWLNWKRRVPAALRLEGCSQLSTGVSCSCCSHPIHRLEWWQCTHCPLFNVCWHCEQTKEHVYTLHHNLMHVENHAACYARGRSIREQLARLDGDESYVIITAPVQSERISVDDLIDGDSVCFHPAIDCQLRRVSGLDTFDLNRDVLPLSVQDLRGTPSLGLDEDLSRECLDRARTAAMNPRHLFALLQWLDAAAERRSARRYAAELIRDRLPMQ